MNNIEIENWIQEKNKEIESDFNQRIKRIKLLDGRNQILAFIFGVQVGVFITFCLLV